MTPLIPFYARHQAVDFVAVTLAIHPGVPKAVQYFLLLRNERGQSEVIVALTHILAHVMTSRRQHRGFFSTLLSVGCGM